MERYNFKIIENKWQKNWDKIKSAKDICIERRINRDIINRERTKEDIKNQINNTVLPMYNKFIKPTKLYADIIIKKIDEQDNDYVKLMSIINQNIN